MTRRARLQASLERIVARHVLPLALVVWLSEWIAQSTDEELDRWILGHYLTGVVLSRQTFTDTHEIQDEIQVTDTRLRWVRLVGRVLNRSYEPSGFAVTVTLTEPYTVIDSETYGI